MAELGTTKRESGAALNGANGIEGYLFGEFGSQRDGLSVQSLKNDRH